MLQLSLSAVRRQRSSNLAPNAPSSPGVSLEEPPGDFPPCWQPGFALALLGAARSLTETSQCLVPGRKSAVPVQRRSSTHAAAPLSSTHRSCSTVRIFVSVWSSSCHFSAPDLPRMSGTQLWAAAAPWGCTGSGHQTPEPTWSCSHRAPERAGIKPEGGPFPKDTKFHRSRNCKRAEGMGNESSTTQTG